MIRIILKLALYKNHDSELHRTAKYFTQYMEYVS